jgi:nucleoside-diphosphate-sugar epimerase
MQTIFITGGTGYMGSLLISALLQTGDFRIKALVREGSEHKLPKGAEIITGDALNAGTYTAHARLADVFIHLIGVPHPFHPPKKKPSKALIWHRLNRRPKWCKAIDCLMLFI